MSSRTKRSDLYYNQEKSLSALQSLSLRICFDEGRR